MTHPLRDLAEKLTQLTARHPASNPASAIVHNCCDHLTALARISELNAESVANRVESACGGERDVCDPRPFKIGDEVWTPTEPPQLGVVRWVEPDGQIYVTREDRGDSLFSYDKAQLQHRKRRTHSNV